MNTAALNMSAKTIYTSLSSILHSKTMTFNRLCTNVLNVYIILLQKRKRQNDDDKSYLDYSELKRLQILEMDHPLV